jgi:hypothetical protein
MKDERPRAFLYPVDAVRGRRPRRRIMRDMTGNRALRLALLGGVVGMMLATPQIASAHSRRHVFKPADVGRDVQVTETGHAPEINPSVLGNAAALIAGGLALLGGRRRRR